LKNYRGGLKLSLLQTFRSLAEDLWSTALKPSALIFSFSKSSLLGTDVKLSEKIPKKPIIFESSQQENIYN